MQVKNAINLRSLDSLRGLLSLYVLAGHARWLLWEGWETWRKTPHGTLERLIAEASAVLRYGHEAVMVFFVLSGFFIHFRAAEDLANAETRRPFHVRDFFRRRVRRLVPPYLFALALTVLLDTAGRHFYAPLYSGDTGDALLDLNFSRGGYTMSSVLSALCLLPGCAGRGFGSDLPLWSLAYEVVFYLLYPAWLKCRRDYGAGVAYGLGGAMGGLGLLMPGLRGEFVGQVLAHYPIWLAGAGLVEVTSRARWSSGKGLLMTTAAVAALGFAGSQWPALPTGGVIVLYACAGTATVLFFARLPARFSEGIIGRSTETMGLCSYTIYICHFPMLALASAAVFRFLSRRPSDGGLALGGAVAATLLCSLCFLWCERPFLTNRRQRHLQPSPA